jgi:hypothetical protein
MEGIKKGIKGRKEGRMFKKLLQRCYMEININRQIKKIRKRKILMNARAEVPVDLSSEDKRLTVIEVRVTPNVNSSRQLNVKGLQRHLVAMDYSQQVWSGTF